MRVDGRVLEAQVNAIGEEGDGAVAASSHVHARCQLAVRHALVLRRLNTPRAASPPAGRKAAWSSNSVLRVKASAQRSRLVMTIPSPSASLSSTGSVATGC